ncbi:MAG: hypothetical protein HDR17_06485 [Lachnospiraceae bacterium]|nr:hypothetical protein [Lachnospiraceae bacterium]
MKKRPIWMGCLLIAMIFSVILFRRADAMRFQGLQVKSEEQLRQLTENLSEISGLQNVGELIELDGKAIPYDRFHNTFYVSQSTKVAEYAGTFHVVGDQYSVYLQEDGALKDKQTAIYDGHVFRLWFVAKEEYAVADLVFTGLPVISIDLAENGLAENYCKGEIVVQNPDDDDVITMSIKDSAAWIKTNNHSGTISFKLCKQDYQEERKLNLLGLGKRTSWKLYPVHERDDSAFREMLAAYVWNCVCEDEKLHRNMEYAEVIVDGQYCGLHYLAPKLGKGYLDLGEDDRLYKAEGDIYSVVGDEDIGKNRRALEEYLSLWDDDNREYRQINAGNYTDYHIWLQAVCGIQSSQEDYCVIAYENNGTYEFCRVPERSKFVFGIYPSEMGWRSLTAAETIMEDEPYERLTEGAGSTIEEDFLKKWHDLRNGALNTEVMRQYAGLYEGKLIESGYIARNANQEEYKAACLDVKQFIERRLSYLDNCYD